MKSNLALSVVAPAGDLIVAGIKTLEVRQWQPETLPLRNLVIVQNTIKLSSDGMREDPNGRAVALVDVESVGRMAARSDAESCASYWEPGWLAWKLSNVRPLKLGRPVPARLRIYSVEMGDC